MIFICQKLNNKWQEAHIGVGYFNSPKNLLKRDGSIADSNMVNIRLKNDNSIMLTLSTLSAPTTAEILTTNTSKKMNNQTEKLFFLAETFLLNILYTLRQKPLHYPPL